MTKPMSRSTGISVTSLIPGPHWPQVLGIGYTRTFCMDQNLKEDLTSSMPGISLNP